MGYLIKWEEGGAKIVLEADTVSCYHCQTVMNKKTWRDDGGWCFGCGRPVCLPCFRRVVGPPGLQEVIVVAGRPELIPISGCQPFKKQIDVAWDLLNRRRAL